MNTDSTTVNVNIAETNIAREGLLATDSMTVNVNQGWAEYILRGQGGEIALRSCAQEGVILLRFCTQMGDFASMLLRFCRVFLFRRVFFVLAFSFRRVFFVASFHSIGYFSSLLFIPSHLFASILLRLDEICPEFASSCFALLRAKNGSKLLRKLRARCTVLAHH